MDPRDPNGDEDDLSTDLEDWSPSHYTEEIHWRHPHG